MRKPIIFLLASALLGGCASTDIQKRDTRAAAERHPRPDRIVIYDINATPADVPASSALTGNYDHATTPQTPEEMALGRQLGQRVSDRLVSNLRKMGMSVQKAGNGPAPDIGNVVITGQFVTIDEGSETQRVIIGFGKGRAELTTHLEGYLLTRDGHRLLGSRRVSAAGGRTPGMALPTAVSFATENPVGIIVGSAVTVRTEMTSETLENAAERTADALAEELETEFRKQGWI